MKGIVLVPSLNRVELLVRFVNSFYETAPNLTLKILVDSEDLKKNKYPDYPDIVNTGDAVSMGAKCRFIYPTLKEYDWIGLLNDDHVCVTKGWDKIIGGMIDGTNMVSTNDGYWNFGHNVVGLTAWSAELLKAAGFPIFPSNIDHWFIDNIWKTIGEKTGCWLETMKINIEHRHVFCGKMEVDATAKLSQDQTKANEAAVQFQKFMDEEFEGVCQRILKLRESHQLKEKFV